ncbi:fimbria/pilus periplasmic chaperone [Serratia plymuthica]|uniref:fimbria/pilus periplasmic chaperone n=1 Tax=Serratia plymuthica TaxID=82996 RepID=UPI001C7E0198|nr:fimbria/pilus periplasmic chaperone [Serratia plymuthica]
MRKHRLSSVFNSGFLACAWILLLHVDNAGAVVNSTQSRIVFNEDSLAESLTLVNSEKAPALVQVWTDDNDPLASPDKISTPLVVVPPVFKLTAGESRNLRVMLVSRQGLPIDRERVYWLNIYQIPPNTQLPGSSDKKVILPLRIRLKVFIRPTGLKAPHKKTGEALIFSLKDDNKQGHALLVNNPTPYNISLGDISLDGKQLSAVMIAPKSSVAIPVSNMRSEGKINWSIIDDYGKKIRFQRNL